MRIVVRAIATLQWMTLCHQRRRQVVRVLPPPSHALIMHRRSGLGGGPHACSHAPELTHHAHQFRDDLGAVPGVCGRYRATKAPLTPNNAYFEFQTQSLMRLHTLPEGLPNRTAEVVVSASNALDGPELSV